MKGKAWSWLANQGYVLDGVHGHFEVHCGHLLHVPSEKGKASPSYRAVCAIVGEDYFTDLSDAPERYVGIAVALGWKQR